MKPQKHRKSKRSLHSRIFAAFMVCALLLIACLWVFHGMLEIFYKQIKIQNLKNTADSISSTIEHHSGSDYDMIKNTANDLAVKNEISITIIESSDELFDPVFSIISNQGNILGDMTPFAYLDIHKETLENDGEITQYYQLGSSKLEKGKNEKAQPKRINDGDLTQWKDLDTDEYKPKPSFKKGAPPFFKFGVTQELLMSKIVKSSDGKEYLLLFDAVITPMTSTVKTLKVQLIIQSLLILIIAAIIAVKMSKKISRPITEINESAKKLAAGNYDTEFSGGNYLEISQLSDTLNHTAKELKQADSLKRELIANTSHDLRTPLTMIIGYAEVMRDLPGENTPENVQVIIDEATRLTNLVNDMLDLSKLQSGSETLSFSEFSITFLTKSIIGRMNKLNEKDGFVFNFKPDRDVFVNADKTKITQVIYNFLINAVNYSEESREVLITQTVSAGVVRLEFTDYGKGIPKDKLPNIWDRYYKIDSVHKRTQSGSGIGLSIVKSVLELHKAKYGVVSNTGGGSTFWFELPVSMSMKK